MVCNNGGSTDYAALRLQTLAEQTAGGYYPLEVENGDGCDWDHLVDMSSIAGKIK